jgi:hypothetical protein
MNPPVTYSVPSLVVNKYMVIVKPSEQLLDRIKRIQNRWMDEQHVKADQLQAGYLLLSRFNMYAAQEERLLRRLHYAAMECAPYRISIDGFFGLPDHSVGLKISNPAPVKQINRLIQIQFSGMKFPGERPYYNQYPAIGLATRLESSQYQEIWKRIGQKHFNAAFTADHLMVLRKAPHANKWSLLDRFAFENLPVHSKQGVLFA